MASSSSSPSNVTPGDFVTLVLLPGDNDTATLKHAFTGAFATHKVPLKDQRAFLQWCVNSTTEFICTDKTRVEHMFPGCKITASGDAYSVSFECDICLQSVLSPNAVAAIKQGTHHVRINCAGCVKEWLRTPATDGLHQAFKLPMLNMNIVEDTDFPPLKELEVMCETILDATKAVDARAIGRYKLDALVLIELVLSSVTREELTGRLLHEILRCSDYTTGLFVKLVVPKIKAFGIPDQENLWCYVEAGDVITNLSFALTRVRRREALKAIIDCTPASAWNKKIGSLYSLAHAFACITDANLLTEIVTKKTVKVSAVNNDVLKSDCVDTEHGENLAMFMLWRSAALRDAENATSYTKRCVRILQRAIVDIIIEVGDASIWTYETTNKATMIMYIFQYLSTGAHIAFTEKLYERLGLLKEEWKVQTEEGKYTPLMFLLDHVSDEAVLEAIVELPVLATPDVWTARDARGRTPFSYLLDNGMNDKTMQRFFSLLGECLDFHTRIVVCAPVITEAVAMKYRDKTTRTLLLGLLTETPYTVARGRQRSANEYARPYNSKK